MSTNEAQAPQWRQLYEAAMLELDPTRLLERTGVARNAVLDRLEDSDAKPDREQQALRDALEALGNLYTIAQLKIARLKTEARAE